MTDSGWEGLFWEAFKRSRNAMVLADSRRCIVEVNGALLGLLGHRRSELVGRPIYKFVAGGPAFTEREWRRLVGQRRFDGVADLVRADNGRVRVQFAAHPEIVTGRQLVLAVAMQTGRTSRRAPDTSEQAAAPGALSNREQEVVRLIALGHSGPEIASVLDLANDTVRSHVRNAMRKVGARSRAQLVAKALGQALVLR